MKTLCILVLAAACGAAFAQENTLSVSAGAVYGPRYAGGKRLQAAPLVGIDYQMANGFFASSQRGIGYQTLQGPLQFSAALGYRIGRSDTDRNGFSERGDAALHGMGEIEGSTTALLGASAALTERLSVNLNVETPLTHRPSGTLVTAGFGATLFQTQTDQVAATLSASAGNRDYMQTWFGVSAAQAGRTSFTTYAPKAGFNQAQASVAWTHTTGDHWSVTGAVSATSLLGDARDSPLAKRRSVPGGALYVSYRF